MKKPAKLKCLVSAISLTLVCLSAQTFAQSVVTTIPLGQSPTSVAVNPKTNLLYAACQSPSSLKVIDGATNSVTATIPLNLNFFPPEGIAVNPTTNRIYVDDYVHGVWVLDGATNAIVTNILLPTGAAKIAVNPVTNMVYVGNSVDRTISVIDGNIGSPTENSVIAVVPLAAYLGGDIVPNSVTNRIYVATNGYDFATNKYRPITVIDGTTNTVSASPLHDFFAGGLALNTVTNKAYMVNGSTSSHVEVLDAADLSFLGTIALNNGLGRLAVNPTTNRIHVLEPFGASVWTIDGNTNIWLIRLWLGLYEPIPRSIAVNPVTSYVYVANVGFNPSHGGQSISVIDDPPTPVVQLQALIERVRSYNLAHGISNSLDAKLENALAALGSMNSGNTSAVCHKLDSFINQIEAQPELTTAQSNDLIRAAARIKGTLGCD